MKASWNIFKNDLKNIGSNWVAMIIIGGLILLPSLYAWFNIGASWDPYGNTDQIPIGVVNEDKGALVRDSEIHVGDELMDSLKENKSMDWQFVDREKAMDKLEYGDYFAVIVIPENFSERLGTVIGNKPKKANVEYFVNEKINAIAPKITVKGASVIVDEISSNFISTVNGIIFEVFNDIGIEIEEKLPDIEKFEDYLFTLEENLPEIHETLIQTKSDADNVEDLISQAQDAIPKAEEVTSKGLETIDNTNHFLIEAENRLDEISPQIEEDLNNIEERVAEANAFFRDLDTATIDYNQENQLTDTFNSQVDSTLQSVDTIKSALQEVRDQSPSGDQPEASSPDLETIDNTIIELENMEKDLKDLQLRAKELESLMDSRQVEIDEIFSTMKNNATMVNERLDAFVKEYTETIAPTVRKEVASAKQTLTEAREILVGIQSTIPEVESILTQTKGDLKDGKNTLHDVLGEFPYVNDKVNELANRIRAIQKDTDINEMIELLRNDPEAEKGFFAEPVVLNENKIFPIENYGTGMTPFYTVLSLWVGGLLLISLLSTDIHGSNAETYTSRQVYFGKLFTFMTIGFFQTVIATLGNLFILKVDVKEPLLFILFGLLCSMIFITIVYTVVSVFGDVGKSLAIIMLVLQIAGSGGTYPVVLLPDFYQIISPFLPFTYAVDLMREAVGGVVWGRVLHDVSLLLLFGILFLILGGFLKETINKRSNLFKKKSRESGLFH